ncbi:MAG: amidohydrolase family protein, partial [Streptosporangiaceae bacterium]
RNPKNASTIELFGELEPIRPEYRDRDARLAVMDRQGMAGAIFLPTLGVGMEQALREDVPALRHAFRAFNRWLNEDWGFAYAGRIAGGRSPADPAFDPFWARANEAGITVLYHGGESHYTRYLADWGESGSTEAFRATAFRGLVSANPTQDTIASMLAHHLFQRFPRLRVASIRSARTGCPTCSTSSRSPTGRRRPCTRRTRGRRSGGTSGSRRSTTTSWARSRT